MKKTIVTLSIAAFIACSMTTASYGQQSVGKIAESPVYKPVVKAEVPDPYLDSNITKSDSTVNYTNFKSDSEENIASNAKNLATLKTKKCSGNVSDTTAFQNKVEDLDKQNNDLKVKLANYTGNKCNEEFNAFKNSFNDDLESVTNSIFELAIVEKK